MTRFSTNSVSLVILSCLACTSRPFVLLHHPVVTLTYQIEYLCPLSLDGKPQGHFGPSRFCYAIGEQGPCESGQVLSFKDETSEVTCVSQPQAVSWLTICKICTALIYHLLAQINHVPHILSLQWRMAHRQFPQYCATVLQILEETAVDLEKSLTLGCNHVPKPEALLKLTEKFTNRFQLCTLLFCFT